MKTITLLSILLSLSTSAFGANLCGLTVPEQKVLDHRYENNSGIPDLMDVFIRTNGYAKTCIFEANATGYPTSLVVVFVDSKGQATDAMIYGTGAPR